MVSFPSFCSFGDNSVLFRYHLVQGPLGTFLLVSLTRRFLLFTSLFFFSHSLIGNFSFFSFCFLFDWKFSFSPFFASSLIGNFPSPFSFDWKFSFSSFFASEGKDWHSHPGSRFMVSQDFGSKLVEWLDMIHVRVWFGSRIKGMPHIISMKQMQKWWFGNFMQNWSCMHLCGHSSVKFLWSCDAKAQYSFPLF